jgi:hypothetical protein
MEKENTEDGGNGLELPKLVGDQGIGDKVQLVKLKILLK